MDIFVYSYAASLETSGEEVNHFEGDLSFDLKRNESIEMVYYVVSCDS